MELLPDPYNDRVVKSVPLPAYPKKPLKNSVLFPNSKDYSTFYLTT